MKSYCEYCHGTTNDDALGHCMACGAPRAKEELLYQHGKVIRPVSVCSTGDTFHSECSSSPYDYPVNTYVQAKTTGRR